MLAAIAGIFDSGLAAIMDVLNASNALSAGDGGVPPFSVTVVGAGSQVSTANGLSLATVPVAELSHAADLLLMPAVGFKAPEQVVAAVREPATSRPSSLDVDNGMRVVREEIFGPVLAVMPFDTEDEVVRLANDTDYGLAAGVWTTNLSRAHRMAARLDAGTVWVNTYRAMSPMSPRQGFKTSGVGVEHGIETIKEYTRLKSVWTNTSEEPVADPFTMRS